MNTNLLSSISDIENLLPTIQVDQNLNDVFINDLINYKNLFELSKNYISNIVESVEGQHIINNKTVEFYKFIDTYQSQDYRFNFFELFESLISKSKWLCDKIIDEANRIKDLPAESEPEKRRINFNTINLDVFYDPHSILSKLLFEKYYHLKKLAATNKSEPSSKPSSPTLNNASPKEKYYLLEVINDASQITEQDKCVYAENLFVLNAFYETMSKSFQSTPIKTVKKLDLVRITPIVSECTKPEDTYKYVPIINSETNECVCYVYIKFWHSNNSSLQSTLSGNSNNRDGNESNNSDNQSQQSIPIYNPIYFFIFNPAHNFIRCLNKFN